MDVFNAVKVVGKKWNCESDGKYLLPYQNKPRNTSVIADIHTHGAVRVKKV